MKSVLVTGGAGYIGAHAVKALQESGYAPVVYDDLSTGYRHNLKFGAFEQGDIRDTPRLTDVLRRYSVSAVLHFAARIEIGAGQANPLDFYDCNMAGTLSLLQAMSAASVDRLVYSSTAAVYGAPDYTPIDEAHPCAPENVYGRSKLMCERMISDAAAASDLRFAALRYFNAAGADPDGALGEEHDPETHLIPNALKIAAGQGPPLQIFGNDYDTPDGTGLRDFIHVSDLARAHCLALEAIEGEADALVCNLGSARGYSVLDVIAMIRDVTGRPAPYEMAERRMGDVPVLVANNARAEKYLGFRPERSDLRTIVQDAARFYEKKWNVSLLSQSQS